jgi:hypothetical protein
MTVMLSDSQKNEIAKMYESGNETLDTLAFKYKISRGTIWNILKQKKVKMRHGLTLYASIREKYKISKTENYKLYKYLQNREYKRLALSHYSSNLECLNCHEQELEFLCLAHNNHDGNIDLKDSKGFRVIGMNFYHHLLKNDFQHPFQLKVLCYNCNWLEEYERELHDDTTWFNRNRLMLINYYTKGENKCGCCGYSNIKALCFDDIDASKKVRGFTARYVIIYCLRYYKQYGEYPNDYQILCFSCNMSKRQQNLCWHKRNTGI